MFSVIRYDERLENRPMIYEPGRIQLCYPNFNFFTYR